MIDLPTIIIEFLAIIPAYVVVVALSILLGSWLVFMIWFRKRTAGLVRVLRSLANSLAEAPGNWETANGIGQAASQENPAVADAWSETEERVISLPNDQRTVPVMLGAPRDLWSSHFLLGRQLNLALADAVPNLLVGIGLLFNLPIPVARVDDGDPDPRQWCRPNGSDPQSSPDGRREIYHLPCWTVRINPLDMAG